ncbi:MAG: hypothetical protein Q7U23_09805 [Methylococcales bacterium]|nr:hypothetical protein [Methylococcales bacterium]
MQLAIELPDDTASEVLQHSNVQEFIQRAIERALSDEKRNQQVEQELFALMANVPKSVSLVDELITDRRNEAKKEY